MRFLWIMISMRQQIAAFQHADWSKTIFNLQSTTKLWSRTRHSLNWIENSENSKKKNSKFSKISNFSSKLKNFNVKFIFDLLLMNYNALILTWIRYCSWPFFLFSLCFFSGGIPTVCYYERKNDSPMQMTHSSTEKIENLNLVKSVYIIIPTGRKWYRDRTDQALSSFFLKFLTICSMF